MRVRIAALERARAPARRRRRQSSPAGRAPASPRGSSRPRRGRHRERSAAADPRSAPGARAERLVIDAARPDADAGEAAARQVVADRGRRRHHRRRGRVEAAQQVVGPVLGDQRARPDIFGKARVVAGGEQPAALAGNSAAPPSRWGPRWRYGYGRRRKPSMRRAASRQWGSPAGSRRRSAAGRSGTPPASGTRTRRRCARAAASCSRASARRR